MASKTAEHKCCACKPLDDDCGLLMDKQAMGGMSVRPSQHMRMSSGTAIAQPLRLHAYGHLSTHTCAAFYVRAYAYTASKPVTLHFMSSWAVLWMTRAAPVAACRLPRPAHLQDKRQSKRTHTDLAAGKHARAINMLIAFKPYSHTCIGTLQKALC